MRFLNQLAKESRLQRFASLPVCLILACLAGNAAAQVRAGTIRELHGAGQIRRNGRVVALATGMPVFAGDRLETPRQSSVTVDLADGSQLVLSDASIVIGDKIANPADPTIELLKGKLRSIVKMVGGKPVEFEVHTPNAAASVRGTEFDTEYIEGKPCPGFPQCLRYTDIGVYKGIVEVRNPTSSKPVTMRVAAGYETTVPCDLPPATPAPLGMGDLTAPGYH